MYEVNVWKLNRPGVPEKDCINWYGEPATIELEFHKKMGDEVVWTYKMPQSIAEAKELLEEHKAKGLITIVQSPLGSFEPFRLTADHPVKDEDFDHGTQWSSALGYFVPVRTPIEFRIIPLELYESWGNA